MAKLDINETGISVSPDYCVLYIYHYNILHINAINAVYKAFSVNEATNYNIAASVVKEWLLQDI